MKRHGNLWGSICNEDALLQAYQAAKKGKAHYSEVKWVDANQDKAIGRIYDSLANKTYKTSDYVVEDRFDGRKFRTIHKLPFFPDRIVQHALVSTCEDIWKRSFIRDTFQSIVGRGTNDARKRVQQAIKGKPGLYALKFDIRKYYPSITNSILKTKIRSNIKCQDTLWLIDDIVDSCEGLPIGNYTSQYFGNIYLNDFDWWVKQTLKPYAYFRYCDDLIVLCKSSAECHEMRKQMFSVLGEHYKLSIKPNWQVFPVDDRGLDFVGFVFTSSRTRLRKSIGKGMCAKAENIKKNAHKMSPYQIANGAGSYWGWCKHGGGKSLWQQHMTTDVRHQINLAKCQIKELQKCM